MPLSITSINSGSNGNCYYVGNEHEAILVDAGISCREIEKRLTRLGLHIKKVKALFISHEHSDHIRGVEVISRKHKLPVYITKGTLRSSGLNIEKDLVRYFSAHQTIQVGELSVTAFPKMHDAAEPHSFVVSGNGVNIGVFTDIGHNCEHVIHHFKQCHAVFLETNYDDTMLETGAYPYYLKKRIRSDHGHLSNAQALELFNSHRPSFMSHVFLSHLSKDNNDPDLVLDLFRQHAGETIVEVAGRYKETQVYRISGGGDKDFSTSQQALQMSLFQVIDPQ
jgi:phosphoribosyl 1,2-cyclic phosphodiesterase